MQKPAQASKCMQNTCPSMKKAANNQYSINNYGAESTFEEAA
jgi:hypothetical protein